MTQLVVKNEGGPGRFCIMPSSVWPTTNFKVSVLLSSWRLSCDTAGTGLPRSGKKFWKMKKIPGQGKVRELHFQSGKF